MATLHNRRPSVKSIAATIIGSRSRNEIEDLVAALANHLIETAQDHAEAAPYLALFPVSSEPKPGLYEGF